MRCAVTGGSGFIGSHVVDQLVEQGHEVVVLDLKTRPHRSDVKFMDIDISDFSSVLATTRGCDFIFHLAAVSDVNTVFENPVYSVKVNIGGTINVLEAARQNKAKRVVFASTVWVYTGARDSHVHENSPFYMPGAGHVYTSEKIASELLCHDYQKLYGQTFTILRYGIPYGPRMREGLVIPIFLKKAFAGEPLTIMGDGGQHRNFIYVEDVAQAHTLVFDERAENQIFNLEGIRPVTVREIAETVQRLVGNNVPIQYMPARPGDYAGKEVSGRKAREVLGWEPTTDFEEGMRRTIEWYKATHNV